MSARVGAATSTAWRGRLVMFLSLFLVPVVIVATPSVASAAETAHRGESVSGTVDGFSLLPIPGNDMSCSVNGQWVVPAASSVFFTPRVEVGGVSCFRGPAFDNIGGGPDSWMSVYFRGDGCELVHEAPITYANGFDPQRLSFGGGSVASETTCDVQEMCMTYHTRGSGLAAWFADDKDSSCVAFPLGLPPVPVTPEPEGCAAGKFRGADYQRTEAGEAYYSWKFADGSTGFWRIGGVVKLVGGTFTTRDGHVSWNVGASPTFVWDINIAAGEEIVGVWAVHPSNDQTKKGWNEPQNCKFYFGQKWFDDGNFLTTHDEPQGGIGGPGTGGPPSAEPVTPPESPVPPTDPDDPGGPECGEFSFFQPSTWASAGFCHIVSALKRVWEAVQAVGSAIGRLPDKIASAFGDLFVPEDGFVADKVDNVKDRWNDTAPVVLVDEVAGLGDTFSIPSPGGCAGPPLNIDTEFTGSLSLNPLSACGPQVSVVANIVKIALTVIVYVGAGLGALRLLGSALGLDLSIDKSGE